MLLYKFRPLFCIVQRKPRNRSWRTVSEKVKAFSASPLVFLPRENRYRRVGEEGFIVRDLPACRLWQAEQRLPLPSQETPPHHLQPQAAGTARSGLWAKPIPWYLLQRGAGPYHQAQWGTHTGGTASEVQSYCLTVTMCSCDFMIDQTQLVCG